MNMIARSIFKILKFLPLFQMLFVWLNKTSPEWNSPLSFQEGFWNGYQFENWPLKLPIEGLIVNWILLGAFGFRRSSKVWFNNVFGVKYINRYLRTWIRATVGRSTRNTKVYAEPKLCVEELRENGRKGNRLKDEKPD